MPKKRKSKIAPPPSPSYYHNSLYGLEIKESNIKKAGLGVFATERIPMNRFVDFYTGDLTTIAIGKYCVEITSKWCMDAFDYPRCYMAMINDTVGTDFEHNVELVIDKENLAVEIWTIQDIEPGDELFMSYGDEYWKCF